MLFAVDGFIVHGRFICQAIGIYNQFSTAVGFYHINDENPSSIDFWQFLVQKAVNRQITYRI